MIINVPNYCIEQYSWESDNKVFRYWLSDSQLFYSNKELDGKTYYKNGKFYSIEKYDSTNEVQTKRKRKK